MRLFSAMGSAMDFLRFLHLRILLLIHNLPASSTPKPFYMTMNSSNDSSAPSNPSPGVSLEELRELLNEFSPQVLPTAQVQSTPVLSSTDLCTSDDHESAELQDTSIPASEDLTEPLQFHYPEMPVALKALLDRNIQVVEYGSQVQYRCGYAEVLILVEWAVPDNQLSLASQILIDNEFPLLHYAQEDHILGNIFWKSPCLAHSLESSNWRRVHLLPLSFVGLTLEETIRVPSTFAHELSLLTPKPPRYFLSLIRHLLKLPVRDSSRHRVEKDIMTFISAYILHGPPSHTPRWVVAQQSEESYQEQVEKGVQEMKEWDWGGIEERYLKIAELAVRNCQYVSTMTDVADNEPSSPIREYDSDTSGW